MDNYQFSLVSDDFGQLEIAIGFCLFGELARFWRYGDGDRMQIYSELPESQQARKEVRPFPLALSPEELAPILKAHWHQTKGSCGAYSILRNQDKFDDPPIAVFRPIARIVSK